MASILVRSDSRYALDIVQLMARSMSGAQQMFEARRRALEASERMQFFYAYVAGHQGDPGNELADVAAEFGKMGRVSCAAAFRRLSLSVGRRGQGSAAMGATPVISLESILYRTKVMDVPDPQDAAAPRRAMAGRGRLLAVTSANVLMLHLGAAVDAVISLRRARPADQFSAARLATVCIQAGRGRTGFTQQVGGYLMTTQATGVSSSGYTKGYASHGGRSSSPTRTRGACSFG